MTPSHVVELQSAMLGSVCASFLRCIMHVALASAQPHCCGPMPGHKGHDAVRTEQLLVQL